MKIKLFSIFIIVIFISCIQESDIYKTNTGAYSTKTGQFEAKFPTVPLLNIEKEKFEDYVYQVYTYKSILSKNEIFSIDYRDYPNDLIKNLSEDDFLSTIMQNHISVLSKDFELNQLNLIDEEKSKGFHIKLKARSHLDE